MNYKSQLKGWAVDRVIESVKAGVVLNPGFPSTMSDIKVAAGDLAAYAYQAEEDFMDACKRVVECLKEMPDALEKVGYLQNELAYIDEQMRAQLSRSKPNGEITEKVMQ